MDAPGEIIAQLISVSTTSTLHPDLLRIAHLKLAMRKPYGLEEALEIVIQDP